MIVVWSACACLNVFLIYECVQVGKVNFWKLGSWVSFCARCGAWHRCHGGARLPLSPSGRSAGS